MKQILIKKGHAVLEEVPAPNVSKGSVLIKTVNSCISAGTELRNLQSSGKPLIKKALDQPERIKKTLNLLKSEGITRTVEKIKGKTETAHPTGYSISGVVISVGEGVDKFKPGNKVAAAGAGIANHAEYVDVPENLVVKMPENVDFEKASTVTLGSIAMQGVRRCSLNLGEFCVVMGTGILGLLAVQILRLSGIRVIAIDLAEKKLNIAYKLGAEYIINPQIDNIVKKVETITGGYGVDAVLFTASTQDSEPLSQSFQMCRKKGKVVLVGVSGMQIKREDMYKKELDLLMSTSYGPGRYDKYYEEKGCDYPYAYVRWTEKRNMSEYLRLVQNKKIELDKIISKIYPISESEKAFQELNSARSKPLMIILDYGKFEQDKVNEYINHGRKVNVNETPIKKKLINVAVIGAGNFVNNVHLPNLKKLSKKYSLYAVVDKLGHKAKSAAQKYNASFATSNYTDVLNDKSVDLVMITTRHNSHAEITLKALKAGKNVFVEKPLATNQKELNKIIKFYEDRNIQEKPVLMVGFNRRFSRYAQIVKKHTDNRINPLFIHYRMNAGYIPLDHWVHENGGRIVGEACHIIDLMTFFTGSKIKSISYNSLSPKNEKFSYDDNKAIVLKYKDGSVCSIHYFSVGNRSFPKEYMEIHFDEKTIVLNDYKSLKGYGLNIEELKTSVSQKGHLEELECLYNTLREDKKTWPIDSWDMIQTTKASFDIALQ